MIVRELTTAGFLDRLASAEPTPGGGGAAALTASQAAALLSMVANFTIDKPKYAEVREEMLACLHRSEALRQRLLTQVDDDAAAFRAVAATYAMPKTTEAEKAARAEALDMALKLATEVPFAVAEASLEIIDLSATVGAKGNRNVVGDAATALHLAHGALQGSLVNVRVNLKLIKDQDFVMHWSSQAKLLAERAARACAHAQQVLGETVAVEL